MNFLNCFRGVLVAGGVLKLRRVKCIVGVLKEILKMIGT